MYPVWAAGKSTFLVIFKAEGGLSEKELAEKAFTRLKESKAILIDKNKKIIGLAGNKRELANAILDRVSVRPK